MNYREELLHDLDIVSGKVTLVNYSEEECAKVYEQSYNRIKNVLRCMADTMTLMNEEFNTTKEN